MVNIRNYSAGVVTGLISVSQGTCYWPDCGEPIVRFVDDVPVNNFETAHVRAANENGPRYVPNMTDEERNSFSNLVLLCLVHHKIVDKIQPNDFSIETMETWKKARESAGQAALQGLRGLTEDRLQELITESFQSFKSTFEEAIAHLEQVDFEAAKLLRPLVNELAEARFRGDLPNEDTAAMLVRASHELAHLQDTVPMLASAANELRSLEDTAHTLRGAAQELKRAREFM